MTTGETILTIVLVFNVLSVLFGIWYSQIRSDRTEAQVARAAELLVASNESVAATARAAAQETVNKLDVIHILVDGSMMAAMQAELDATIRTVALMHEVIDLKKSQGQEPSAAAVAAIKSTDERIAEMEEKLKKKKTALDESKKKETKQ
jgi:hypothetical protein